MPHVVVELWPGKSDAENRALTAIVRDAPQRLGLPLQGRH
jgi:hypothetical protein